MYKPPKSTHTESKKVLLKLATQLYYCSVALRRLRIAYPTVFGLEFVVKRFTGNCI